jgi:hypothetical protein
MSSVPSENTMCRFDDELGWSYVPNLNSSQTECFPNDKKMTFNEKGMRISSDETVDYKKESVLFIGCSFTMGHGVNDDETFVYYAGRELNEKYQSVNLGVQGYGTDQALIMLERSIDLFEAPVAVIYTMLRAHFQRNANYDRRWLFPDARVISTKPLFKVDSNGELKLKKKPVKMSRYVHSFLFDFLYIKYLELTGRFPPLAEKVTEKLILKMNTVCQERGVFFAVVDWNSATRSLFDGQQGFPIIDLEKHVPQQFHTMVVSPDNRHPSAEAHKVVAEIIADFLRSEMVAAQHENTDS